MKNLLGRAIEIATSAHSGQTDKGGRPYILHPLWVMNKLRHLGDDYMIVGVLHDTIEDSEWTIDQLRSEGFSEEIITAITLLTHEQGQSYDDYIKAISLNPLARAVKIRDLEHNTKITRLKGLRKKDFDRMEKYHRAYVYLKND